jgi:hypothetical protein
MGVAEVRMTGLAKTLADFRRSLLPSGFSANDRLRPHWADTLPLLGLFVLVGQLAVRHRVDSMWFEPEFTGWVSPIARRIAEGQVLYADGGHFPVPPLPYVLMRLLFGRGANWFDESLVNFLCQCGLVLSGYVALSRWLPRPLPLVAAVAAAGFYFALTKSIMYDAMAQCLAGCCIAAASWGAAECWRLNEERRSRLPFVLAGAFFSALLLSKQSTALGTAAGLGCFVALLRPPGEKSPRLGTAAAIALGISAVLPLLAALVTPYVSWPGMIYDVYVTGGQPKSVTWKDLTAGILFFVENYALDVGIGGLIWLGAVYAIASFRVPRPQLVRGPLALPPKFEAWGIAAAVLPVALCLYTPKTWMPKAAFFDRNVGMADFNKNVVVEMGFAVLTCVIARAVFVPAGRLHNFGLICLIAMLAACGHNLSDLGHVRLTYDNNAVAAYAPAALLGALAGLIAQARLPRTAERAALAACCFAVVLSGWTPMIMQVARFRDATISWPEISYLDGAYMPTRAGGLREFADYVRDTTAPGDEVLLLPEDPDIEAWMERPRPKIQGGLIFTDMYWPRYLDEDIRRLSATPPKLIIIGPRRIWRTYSQGFSGVDGVMIDRLKSGLLPKRYKLVRSADFAFRNWRDYMDIYERIDSDKPGRKGAPSRHHAGDGAPGGPG